jgi:hypothetical protein
VLLEIQDTLRQPPPSQKTMGGAVKIAVTAAFAFYFATSVSCYSALGNDVPGEVLTGFTGGRQPHAWPAQGGCVCVMPVHEPSDVDAVWGRAAQWPSCPGDDG